jgi:hypothetical protein
MRPLIIQDRRDSLQARVARTTLPETGHALRRACDARGDHVDVWGVCGVCGTGAMRCVKAHRQVCGV